MNNKSAIKHLDKDIKPYDQSYFATIPTPTTRFFRTFIPYQLWRFAWINIKMIRMIAKSHK